MIETGFTVGVFPFLISLLLPNRVLVHSLALVESMEYDGDMQYDLSRIQYDVREWVYWSLLGKRMTIEYKGGYD